MDDVSGRDEVVEQQGPDRERRSEACREATSEPRAATPDEQEERGGKQGGQPRRAREAEQEAGEELASVDAEIG
jgi:hypothetical protein